MQASHPKRDLKTLIVAVAAIGFSLVAPAAQAYSRHHATHHSVHYARHSGGGVIQCVAFAKAASDIALSGNARDWWYNADGVYQRGARPEAGAVLAFKENGRMPLGHVAVVSSLQDSRTIAIDQAHWNSGGISRDILVKDVSENNDWSAVRVQLGRGEAYGSIYPTHGFIYARPDQGTMVANNSHAPLPDLDQAPADLRTTHARRGRHAVVEVAEASEAPAPSTGLDLSVPTIASDAPDRNLK